MNWLLKWIEKGIFPDWMVRIAIRRLLRQRLQQEDPGSEAELSRKTGRLVDQLRFSPLAIHTEEANRQHYALPSEFFDLILGKHRKYSSCYWTQATRSLDEAEAAMLSLTCDRARLADGMRILDMGCGWGSLTLWVARHYPRSRLLALSNSPVQRRHILDRAARAGISNIEVVTCDVNDFDTSERFDRVISIEMFEHIRNYRKLLSRIASWLKPEGKLFVHIFCHDRFAYPFETQGAGNWMGRHFFTGGLMPSAGLLSHFQDDLAIEQQWAVDGNHYARTARAWLKNLDARKEAILPLFRRVYQNQSELWFVRWRLFFMACEELFGYRNGREWYVSHYLFKPGSTGSSWTPREAL